MNSIKDKPFAQDSLPIGTVVEWEEERIKVVAEEGCSGCYFESELCLDVYRWCDSSANSDGLARKYILINEQQEEQPMSIELEDGKKYVTEGGEVVTVNLVRELASVYPYKGSNGFLYTINGKLYFNEDNSPNDIVREYVEEVKQEPEGHVHAELMLEYAKDALVSRTPWKGWEFTYDTGDSDWDTCSRQPVWDETCRYRRKPKTILINGYEVPNPLKEEGSRDGVYWVPSLNIGSEFAIKYYWDKTVRASAHLDMGFAHKTKEAAELHAKALLSFTTTLQEKQDEEV